MQQLCKAILSIKDLLNTDANKLKSLTHLYLANNNVHTQLSVAETRDCFISCLEKCTNVTHLNLYQNQIDLYDLKLLLPTLESLPKLRYLNLRKNSLQPHEIVALEILLLEKNPNLTLIAVGAKTMPTPFEFPDGWETDQNWSAEEFKEMITVLENPSSLVLKYHAFRADGSKKKYPLLHIENEASNLPISALYVNNTIFLLPKFIKAPNRIHDYNIGWKNKVARQQDSQPLESKSFKLIVHKPYDAPHLENMITFSATKTYRASSVKKIMERMLADEAIYIGKNGSYALAFKRFYHFNRSLSFPFKNYLIMPYQPGIDTFDYIKKSMKQLYTSGLHDNIVPTTLLDIMKNDHITNTFAHLLTLMLLHAADGLIHGDVKPENFVISKSNNVVPIDFGFAHHNKFSWSTRNDSQIDPITGNAKIYTFAYAAPEILDYYYPKYSPAADAFSAGILIRQILYPIFCQIGKVQLLSLDLNNYLANGQIEAAHKLNKHFYDGIAHNYKDAVAGIIQSLTEPVADKRLTLPAAFAKLATIYPDIAILAYNRKLTEINATINNVFQKHPGAAELIHDLLPDFDVLRREVTDHINLYADLNKIFRLKTLSNFLILYLICNGELPKSTNIIFAKAIKSLYSTADLSDFNIMTQKYYTDSDIDTRIDIHYVIMTTMLNGFAGCAKKILHKNNLVESAIVAELREIQGTIKTKWHDFVPIATISEYAADKYQAILDCTLHTESDKQILRTVFSNCIDFINTEILPESTRKSQRLSL